MAIIGHHRAKRPDSPVTPLHCGAGRRKREAHMAERSRMAVGVLVLDAEPGVPHGCSEIDFFEIRRSAPLLEKLLRPRPSSVRRALA